MGMLKFVNLIAVDYLNFSLKIIVSAKFLLTPKYSPARCVDKLCRAPAPFKMPKAPATDQQLEDITKCARCQEVYTDPRYLPCTHTFCLECVFKCRADDKKPTHAVKCPLCRKVFTISNKEIGDLPKNVFIRKLLTDKALFATRGVEDILCNWCQKGEVSSPAAAKKQAEVRCIDCQENLCKDCNSAHSKHQASRHHEVITIEAIIDEAYKSSKCTTHPDRDLDADCLDCQETLCIKCLKTLHKGHRSKVIGGVERAAGKLRFQMNGSVSRLEKNVIVLSESLNKLQEVRGQVVDKFNAAESEINAKAYQLIATIENHRRQLLTECNQLKDERLKEVDHAINEISQNKTLAENLKKRCDKLIKKGSDSDVTREAKSIRSQTEEMEKFCQIGLVSRKPDNEDTFLSAADVVFESVNCLGKFVKGNGADPSLVYCIPSGTQEPVSALTSLDNQLFVTRKPKSSDQIAVYDASTFQLLRHVTVHGATGWLFGLAACAANIRLYASDNTNKVIHTVTLTSDAALATKWSVAGQPAGLSVNGSHNVLVAFYGSKKIEEYTPSGSRVRMISARNPWHAVQLDNGTLAVSHWGTVHGALLVSGDGKVLHSYASTVPGSEPGQMMNSPRSLTADKRGFVLVADAGNNRILVLNPSMSEARPLSLSNHAEEQLITPYALWLDESRGRLYVGEYGGRCRVLIFDNVFNLSAMFSPAE